MEPKPEASAGAAAWRQRGRRQPGDGQGIGGRLLAVLAALGAGSKSEQQIRSADGVRKLARGARNLPNPSKFEKSLLISRLICVSHCLMFSHLY